MNDDEETHTATVYTSYENTSKQKTDVLLKTAVSQVSVGNCSISTNILLDEGSQKSFITEDLAQTLQLKPCGMSTLSLAAFGETNRNVRNLEEAVVHLETKHGGKLKMEVLIVPTIAAPLSNLTHYEALKLSYLQGIELDHPMSKDEHFETAMLIGADYYWDIVENDILRGMGPTAV